MIRQFLPLSLFLLSVGCDPELRYNPIDKGDAGDGGQGDSGTGDGGPLPDGRVLECTTDANCDSNAPKCVGHVCTSCSSDEDCQSFADTPACLENGKCGECSAGNQGACNGTTTPFCLVGGSECVQCNDDSDCDDTANPKCDTGGTNRCVPCDNVAQCAHRGDGLNTCGPAGACVECTPEIEADTCGANACDPVSFTCGSKVRGSVTACGACAADSECTNQHKCVPVPYMGAEHGYFCMELVPAMTGCAQLPYRSAPLLVESRNGYAAAKYCSHNTNATTCDAIRSLGNPFGICTEPTAVPDCGEGAVCGEVNTTPGRCTYKCSTDLECPAAAPCNEENGLVQDHTCGGPA